MGREVRSGRTINMGMNFLVSFPLLSASFTPRVAQVVALDQVQTSETRRKPSPSRKKTREGGSPLVIFEVSILGLTFFYILSENFCFLIRIIRPYNMIIDMVRFKYITFLLFLSHLFFVPYFSLYILFN